MRSETNGRLQVQVPAKGGGFGANYVLTRVCNVSGLEKPQTRVCGRVSKVERKRAPFRAFNLSQIPLVKKWTALGKLDFSNPTEGGRDNPISSGYVLQNYWNLLEAEFKPKGNKLLSVIELWSRSKQGSRTLNEWLTYVYNLVELCNYGASKDRIIRDVLIIGCNSDKAKDKIVRQGEKIKLQEVIETLQMEDSTRQTLSETSSSGQKNFSSINYVSYDKKKSKVRRKV